MNFVAILVFRPAQSSTVNSQTRVGISLDSIQLLMEDAQVSLFPVACFWRKYILKGLMGIVAILVNSTDTCEQTFITHDGPIKSHWIWNHTKI